MPQFYGTDEVRRQSRRLATTFDLVNGASLDAELASHYARYLCVRLAGFAEQSLKDLVSQYARYNGNPELHRYVSAQVNGVWGISSGKLKSVLGLLNAAWPDEIAAALPQELDSLNSVGKTRDNVSHGGDQGITLDIVNQYRVDVEQLVKWLCNHFDPKGP